MKRSTLLRAQGPAKVSVPVKGKCKHCGGEFVKRSRMHTVCSPACTIAIAEAKMRRDEARAAVADRKETRARREALKTRADYMREAQTAFNAYIRERDRLANRVCVCCGQPLDWTGNNVDAGHYRSRGSAPHMRFVENNCWAQRKQCNRYGAGRAVDYRIGLVARIGLEAVEALEADNTPRKWSIEELRAIKALYKQKLKDLKNA